MKVWKTQNKNRYSKLVGMTVAVRTVNKIPTNPWEGIDYERDYKIVKIKEHFTLFFSDEENKEYSIGDIIKIF
jgi:adenine C2-methylase RlmN of 23S rRNA A2503 and tRNA A37